MQGQTTYRDRMIAFRECDGLREQLQAGIDQYKHLKSSTREQVLNGGVLLKRELDNLDTRIDEARARISELSMPQKFVNDIPGLVKLQDRTQTLIADIRLRTDELLQRLPS